MTYIFHAVDLDPIFYMLLAHPWIHDHQSILYSWHQCIKIAPIKGNQVHVHSLKNPFMLEEVYFTEIVFLMAGNVLKLVCQKQIAYTFLQLSISQVVLDQQQMFPQYSLKKFSSFTSL